MLALAPTSSNQSQQKFGTSSSSANVPLRSLPSLPSNSSLGSSAHSPALNHQPIRSPSAPPLLDRPSLGPSFAASAHLHRAGSPFPPAQVGGASPQALAPPQGGPNFVMPSHTRSGSSTASLPRMPAAHVNSAPPSPSAYAPHAHPAYGAPGGGYPFVVPQHTPMTYQGGGHYSPSLPVGQAVGGAKAIRDVQEQQRLMALAQQQQAMHWQNQMAMSAHHQSDWGPNGQRRRATSGPNPKTASASASASGPGAGTFHPSTVPYPMPALPPQHIHNQHFQHNQSYPNHPRSHQPHQHKGPGSFGAQHGYPSPPASDGSANGRADAAPYHPYRRDQPKEGNKVQRVPVPQVPAVASGGGKENNRYSQQFPALPSRPSALAAPGAGSPYAGASSAQTSSTSVASSHSRTTSASARASPVPTPAGPSPLASAESVRTRTDSAASSIRSTNSSVRPAIGAHGRSASSSEVSIRTGSSSFDGGSRSATPVQAAVGKKPSPLSRANADEDDEAEDSDDTAGPASVAKGKTGLGARFKKFGGPSSTREAADSLSELSLEGRRPPVVGHQLQHGRGDSISSAESSTPRTPPSLNPNAGASTSSRPPNASKSSRFSILNSKLNGSSDNLSISSTVSSASMMLRKIGNMGKIARRSSMMSLTKAFGKKKDKDGPDSGGEEPKLSKKDRKKAQASSASVSHATVEIEPHENGISPAAALAKKQQKLYAEQDAARQKAKEEAERMAEKEANKKSFMVHERNASSASLASVTGTEKKKKKWFGGAKKDKENEDASSFRDDASIRISAAAQGSFGPSSASARDLYDDPDRTPRQSLEVLEQPYAAYGALPYDDGGQQHTPRGSIDEDHGQMGVMPMWRRDAKAAKGVLKGAGTYNQDDYAPNKTGPAGLHRARASSFDASNSNVGHGQQNGGSVLTHELPDATTIDGAAVTEARAHPHDGPLSPPHLTESPRPSSPSSSVHSSQNASPYSFPALNASAPALNHPSLAPLSAPIRAQSSPGGRRISFAQNLSVHTTWPATVYDRRPELGTCNRLTPTLAQRIKEELNAFKMEEMEVHPSSRHWTQFFV